VGSIPTTSTSTVQGKSLKNFFGGRRALRA